MNRRSKEKPESAMKKIVEKKMRITVLGDGFI